jgi:hypothetical protein
MWPLWVIASGSEVTVSGSSYSPYSDTTTTTEYQVYLRAINSGVHKFFKIPSDISMTVGAKRVTRSKLYTEAPYEVPPDEI